MVLQRKLFVDFAAPPRSLLAENNFTGDQLQPCVNPAKTLRASNTDRQSMAYEKTGTQAG